MDTLLSHASIGETADVATNVSSAISKATIEDDYLTTKNTSLKAKADLMVKGLGTIRGKELTEKLETADTLRDDLLSALIFFLKGFLRWNKSETVTAADLLMKIVKAHGSNFSRLSNEKESAAYDSLAGELEKEDSVNAITALGLTSLVAEMKEAETNFKSLYLESAEIEAGKTDIIAPTSIKRETQLILNEIIGYLDIMNKANPSVYGTLAANVAELIDTVNKKIRIRKTTSNESTETGETSN